MNVVPMEPLDVAGALEVLDSLREAVKSGDIKAFACVGISRDHETLAWLSSTTRTTRLEFYGGISWLLNGLMNGDDE